MKTYEPRRNNTCPNGLHPDYDPTKDPSQNECTCPWLIIQSSTPVQHLTSWNRRETENFIREVDRGYFDPPGYPKRTGSMFLSPAMQRLLDVAEKEPVAAALTLLAGSGSGLPPFDAIAWDAEDAVLSLRIGGGGWWHLFLGKSNVEAVTNHDDAHAAGANPVLLWADHPDTTAETGLPVIGPLSVRFPVPTVDYFAEDITRRAREEAEGVAADAVMGHLIYDEIAPQAAAALVTRGGVQFPIDVPEDVFLASQVKDCGWALVDNAGTFVCTLTADHGNNHSDGGRTWYDSGTDDCTCAVRGSGPDTYACPEHPADARCAVPVRVLYPGEDIGTSTAYCEKVANHSDVHAGGGFAWSYDELEITAPQRRYAPDVID